MVLWNPTRLRSTPAECRNNAQSVVTTDSLTADKRGTLLLAVDNNGTCEDPSVEQEAEQTFLMNSNLFFNLEAHNLVV